MGQPVCSKIPDSMPVNALCCADIARATITIKKKKRQKPTKHLQKKYQSDHRPPTNIAKKRQHFPWDICYSNDHLSYQRLRKTDLKYVSKTSGRWLTIKNVKKPVKCFKDNLAQLLLLWALLFCPWVTLHQF